eukprot:scaffold1380_cov161-Amphora_coffeaeformis.AAC.5
MQLSSLPLGRRGKLQKKKKAVSPLAARDAMHLPEGDSLDIPIQTVSVPTTSSPSNKSNKTTTSTRERRPLSFLQPTSKKTAIQKEHSDDFAVSPMDSKLKSDIQGKGTKSHSRVECNVKGGNTRTPNISPSSRPRPDKRTRRVEGALARSTKLPVHQIRDLRKNRSDPSRNNSKFTMEMAAFEKGRRTPSIPDRRSFASSSCTSSITESVDDDRRGTLDLIDDEYNHIANMMIALDRSPSDASSIGNPESPSPGYCNIGGIITEGAANFLFEAPAEEEDTLCTEVLIRVGKAAGLEMGVLPLRSLKDRQCSETGRRSSASISKKEHKNDRHRPWKKTPCAPQNMTGKHIIVFTNEKGRPGDPFDTTRDASFLTNETSFLTNDTSFYTHNNHHPEESAFLETETTRTDWIVEKETRDGGADVFLSLLFCNAI